MHASSSFLLKLLVLLLSFQCVSLLNILVFNPIFGFSHVKFASKLADIIADHGHNVTLFQPWHNAMKNTESLVKNKNVEIINYFPDNFEELKLTETQTFPIFWDSKWMQNKVLVSFVFPTLLSESFRNTSTQLLRDKKVLDYLRNRKFDVVLSETFDITGHYVAWLLDLPCIPFITTVRFPCVSELFGQPSHLGYAPPMDHQMPLKDVGFLDRLRNIYQRYTSDLAQGRMLEYQYKFIKEVVDKPVPYWKDLVTQTPIYIAQSNLYLDFAVPTTATIVHAGGITMNLEKLKHAAALSEEYESILNERNASVLISFGSVIRSYEMPESFKSGIIQMFRSLPNVTFIWKYEREDVELQKRLPNNVHLKKWVPQPALLSDERLNVFVTHGGLGSTQEIAYTGKPAIVIPVFGDQPSNAQMLARHGGAVSFDKFDLQNGQKLTNVIREMVTNPIYNEKARELADILANQPIDPTVNLMRHLEFAIKFPNLRAQVPSISLEGPIAFYYLDVIAFIATMVSLIIFVSYELLKKFPFRLIVRKPKTE